jgi:ABC-type glycerol-3-phosphate transport system permease component
MKSYRLSEWIANGFTYIVLLFFALIMLFPFIYMMTTSLKTPADTFRYPPRLLPNDPVSTSVAGLDEEKPLYYVEYQGQREEFALIESNVPAGIFVDPDDPAVTAVRRLSEVQPTCGEASQAVITYEGKEAPLFDIVLYNEAGEPVVVPMVQTGRTTVGIFVDPQNPQRVTEQNVRLSEPVERLSWHPENYVDVLRLRNLDRSLSNTALVTLLVTTGQLLTSVAGGYAFARLRFPGRDTLFVLYLGTIMIPFVLLIVPLYQLMVLVGWVDTLASLVVPWIFTAYGTFLMRQFFLSIPKEIEEAALLDGASRFQILLRVFIPASVPALATLGTFAFLYAWNSFFWPLVIINTGNEANHVLTLSLNVLRGRASDSPNLILAGAAIAILPPFIIYLLGQRFFVESATSSGVKG